MKIAFAASEMVPWAKTGGLADVTGTLSREILGLGHEVIAFLPLYKGTGLEASSLETAVQDLKIQLGSEEVACKILKRVTPEGLTVYFVDHHHFFYRDELYGTVAGDFPDNDRRFVLFQKAVLETLKILKWKPDILHCHDWQTALIPVYLKTVCANDVFFQKTKTVLTIHNLAYQGNFPPDSLSVTGLDWDQFTMDRLEFYGKLSFLKGGILDADKVVTVSDRYSREIQTREFGNGMDGTLVKYREKLVGIVNGIDPKEWNPEADGVLPATFSVGNLEGKARCKEFVQKENFLNLEPQRPLIGVITRLVDQKGIELLVESMDRLFEMGAQMVVLGTGDEKYHRVLREAARKRRGQCSVHILFDSGMAKRIYAGADMLLVPSWFEPCGLSQMIALRYGTVPVVRAVGGLADTIEHFDAKSGTGNGFSFEDYKAETLLAAVKEALGVYASSKDWNKLVRNAMMCDYSWKASAQKYIGVYEGVMRPQSRGHRKG